MEVVYSEISNKGGIINLIMLKDGDGEINWGAVALIYPAMFLLSTSMYIMFKDAKNEIMDHRKKVQTQKKKD